MYLVKDLETLNLDSILIEIVEDLESVAGPGYYTSIYRPEDPGVHGQMPVRGIDRRCRHQGIGVAICLYINSRWQYDPARPTMDVAIFHKCDQYGWHIHLQSHPNTRRR